MSFCFVSLLLQQQFLLIAAIAAIVGADVSHLFDHNSLDDGYYYPQPQRQLHDGGYEYPVPQVSFNLPEPLQQYNPRGGYVYEEPSNPLIYPEKQITPAVSRPIRHQCSQIKIKEIKLKTVHNKTLKLN